MLLTYHQFCKMYFKSGSQNVLPKDLTKFEFQNLLAYLNQPNILSPSQAKAILSDVEYSKSKDDEKDEAGNVLEFMSFETASPYILVAFFCYVTDMIKRRRQQLLQMFEGDEINSLTACFEQSGLKQSDQKKKVITYAMAE